MCEGEVGTVVTGDEEEDRMLDFGRPKLVEPGDEGDALAKGLLRRDTEPWGLLNDIFSRRPTYIA